MSIAIRPKLLRHLDGLLYAYRGYNQIAFRFGRQVKVAKVLRRMGPFCVVGPDFFECVDVYEPAPRA